MRTSDSINLFFDHFQTQEVTLAQTKGQFGLGKCFLFSFYVFTFNCKNVTWLSHCFQINGAIVLLHWVNCEIYYSGWLQHAAESAKSAIVAATDVNGMAEGRSENRCFHLLLFKKKKLNRRRDVRLVRGLFLSYVSLHFCKQKRTLILCHFYAVFFIAYLYFHTA